MLESQFDQLSQNHDTLIKLNRVYQEENEMLLKNESISQEKTNDDIFLLTETIAKLETELRAMSLQNSNFKDNFDKFEKECRAANAALSEESNTLKKNNIAFEEGTCTY